MIYTVKSGDTLSTVAERYNVSVTKLKRANRLTSNMLRVGDRLEIPSSDRVERNVKPAPETRVHVVRSGDTLSEIGERYGVSVSKLRSANGLRGNNLRIGQRLVIPATASKVEKATTRPFPLCSARTASRGRPFASGRNFAFPDALRALQRRTA